MFLTLPKSTPCSTSPITEDSQPKSRRHSSIFSLVKSKKEKRKSTSKPYTYPIDTSSPLIPADDPPHYDTIAPKIHISTTNDPPKSPSLHSPTRSRSRGKQTHLRRPSQPWTNPPNSKPSPSPQSLNQTPTFYPPTTHGGRKVVVSGTPPKEGPLCPYSTFYPATPSQTDDMHVFSPFGSAPGGGGGFYGERKEVGRKGRRISTGCAWEKIGERRAREGLGRWS